MSNEQVKAIELKGIVHNSTKINTQDGQCEDIINLRFKDGSWRTSGDGKQVYSMKDGSVYAQLFVHTNIYRHLLGVKDDKLYWFANISTDGVSFSELKNESNKPAPVLICSVTGDLFITQTGHLLTIIDSEKNYVYALFNAMNSTYKVLNVDENGSVYDRKLYPFGEVHFNLDCNAKTYTDINRDANLKIDTHNASAYEEDGIDFNYNGSVALGSGGGLNNAKLLWHTSMLNAINNATKDNKFTNPFLACIALKLYDGTYIYASTPVLLYPHQRYASMKIKSTKNGDSNNTENYKIAFQKKGCCVYNDGSYITIKVGAIYYKTPKIEVTPFCKAHAESDGITDRNYKTTANKLPFYTSWAISVVRQPYASNQPAQFFPSGSDWFSDIKDKLSEDDTKINSEVYGADILLSIGDIDIITQNKDLFTGIGIFITKPSPIYDISSEGYKKGQIHRGGTCYRIYDSGANNYTWVGNASYAPPIRSDADILYDLMHSPFYLLRDYSVNELSNLQTSLRVDLSSPEYKGVLSNIEQQPTFNGDFNSRATYVPKVAYSYNQRLHIANYTKTLFHGYPIEQFMFNNHDGVVNNAYSDRGLKNFRVNDYYSFHKDSHVVGVENDVYHQGKIISATINTYIKTDDGDAIVSRVLSNPPSGTRQFLEALPPLIFYPDSRAYKMAINICLYNPDTGKYAHVSGAVHSDRMKPHPLYNLSYGLLKSGLEPFELWKLGGSGAADNTAFNFTDNSKVTDIEGLPIGQEKNATEDMPNVIKVSSTSNPFIFPAKNTYQVGSSEIMALCSNAVAIGTGQTGAAPLYVFCKDGVYALLVDSSGEMVYTNSRIIARDVINQYNRATPIDDGVVFTTDRGLMSVSGSEVVELGQQLEGDCERFYNAAYPEYNKIATNAYTMKKLAGLPSGGIEQTDFLTYLRYAIINYNHNERELMVSSSRYPYSYILDRYGNWSRRYFSADEYINNYPTSYRKKGNTLYKVDANSDADNAIFVMSKVLKLDSIGFKELHRVVARGLFKTQEPYVSTPINDDFGNENTIEQVDILYKATEADGVSNNKLGISVDTNGYIKQENVGNRYRIVIDNSNDSDHEICAYIQIKKPGYIIAMPGQKPEGVYLQQYSDICWGGSSETMEFEITQDMVGKPLEILLYICRGEGSTETIGYVDASICTYNTNNHLGLYIFGSYDGRKWSCLGHREKRGTFTDIGALVEHTDCRYFRFVLAGKLAKESRFDYIEVSSKNSKLSTKIR